MWVCDMGVLMGVLIYVCTKKQLVTFTITDIVETAARIAGPAMDVVGLSSVFIALNTCKGYCLEKEASLKAPRAAAVETNVQSEQPTRRGARRRVM